MTERPVPQSNMGRGWNADEREAARNEPSLASPQWECIADQAQAGHFNRRCDRCLVAWHGEVGSACWLCGRAARFEPMHSTGFDRHSTVGRYDYGRMQVPAGGCGCDDDTVEVVAERAEVVGVWKACEETYGGAA